MIEQREQDAQDIYFKLLSAKDFDSNTFDERKRFLNKLLPLLAKKDLTGAQFRQTIETLMDSIDKANWPESLLMSIILFGSTI